MTKPAGPPLIDNSQAPDLFAADAVGFFAHEGVVYMTFAAPKVNHTTTPSSINRTVVARLAMPIKGARQLAESLFDFISKQQDAAVIPTAQDGRTRVTSPARLGRDKPN